MNFMAAMGPDFKTAYRSAAPASNADVGRTIAHLLGLKIVPKGRLTGRVLNEALVGGKDVSYSAKTSSSAPTPLGLRTLLRYWVVGSTRYFDAAGFADRTVGLDASGR